MALDRKSVIGHALHVLLDDGLQELFHSGLLPGHSAHEIVFHQAVIQQIESCGFVAVKLQYTAALHQLVDAVEIVHSPGIFLGRVEEVDTKSEVGFGVMEHAQKCGENVYLLGNLIEHLTFGTTGVEDDDR